MILLLRDELGYAVLYGAPYLPCAWIDLRKLTSHKESILAACSSNPSGYWIFRCSLSAPAGQSMITGKGVKDTSSWRQDHFLFFIFYILINRFAVS